MSEPAMRACVIPQFGPAEVLEVREVARPSPGPGEVLVRVRATALNRADLLQRMGRYPAPGDAPPDIPGIEFAGEVVALGPEVHRWQPGDRVFAIVSGGAHAEYVRAQASALTRIPDRLSWTDAAAVPEAFITAHDALVTQAGLREGELLLVHAVGSGVGLAAAQVGKAWGARVFGTSRTEAKLSRARAFGMEDGLQVTDDPSSLGSDFLAWSQGREADVILDLLGGPYVAASVAVAALRARLMLVGAIAGSTGMLDVRRVLSRRLTLRGTVLRARGHMEKAAVAEAFARDLLPLLDSGALVPAVDSVFPLSRIADAHRRMESNDTFGKVVIEVG
jgi:putative PIG3 family NAD(P)H quinone oxidoreductase